MTGYSTLAGVFQRHDFGFRVFSLPEEVQEAFAKEIERVKSIGFGGSATLRQLKLDRVAQKAGLPLVDHWEEGLSGEEVWQQRLAQGRSEMFVTSANAVTSQGQLVLVDGVGNRLAASVFGPRKVLFVVGENKIVSDLNEAFIRIKTVAAPQRAAELNIEVPCAKNGECTDCVSPGRICRGTLIIERPSMGLSALVWLVRGQWGL